MHQKHEKSKPESENKETKVPLYIGLDLSGKRLDVSCSGKYTKFSNTAAGINKLSKLVSSQASEAFVVYESTGCLSRKFAAALAEKGIPQICVNPTRVRQFARAMDIKAKTDKLDCDVIARYAQAKNLQPNVTTNLKIHKLKELEGAYNKFTRLRAHLRTAQSAYTDDLIHDVMEDTIKGYDKSLASLEAKMQQIIDSDAGLKARYDFYLSLQGIGPRTAKALVISMPELGMLSPKKAASLIGVAPYNWDSGSMRGKRIPRFGRKNLRCLLYLCVISLLGSKANPIKDFFKKLRLKGKKPRVAIVACIRKFVIQLNAATREWLRTRQLRTETA